MNGVLSEMTNNDSRQRIIAAALKEFAEKGFEGARVEEIAKRAQVSKALIYYNFESKEAILSELLDDFQKDLVNHLSLTYELKEDETKWKHLDPDEIKASMDFILAHRLQYKVLVMESIISSAAKDRILTLWDNVNNEVRTSILAKRGYRIETADMQQHLVDFFFIYIPTVMFSILGFDWAKINGYDLNEVNAAVGKTICDLYNMYMN
jgi:AcrR family transcriptional regulator